ncbi:Protein of unknown function [Marinobacter daqiaonensis]|uniref:DUF3309 domain-containing protein n=1 Tax=Marinobacter daqiaonensis TaxID=650891 RepID=A0A1I6I4J4_9GAMM|nr:DUF3309 family protein [Marinobacter daqiaonensis]SFR61666.1 Protein of unknown function [Marinobacter daqiaonensis]
MSVTSIFVTILVLALAGVVPAWPSGRAWGYAPSGAVGVTMLVLLIWVMTRSI